MTVRLMTSTFVQDAIARIMVCFYAPDGAALESFNLNVGRLNEEQGPRLFFR